MARLTAQQRKALPVKAFAIPKGTAARQEKTAAKGTVQAKGSFPVPDKAHARNALARAHQAPHGKGSTADKAVHAKVANKFPALAKQHIQNAHGRRGK